MSTSAKPPPHQKAELFKIALVDLLDSSSLKTGLDVLTLVDLILDYGPSLVELDTRIEVLSTIQTKASQSFLSAWSTSSGAIRLTKLWLDAAFSPTSMVYRQTQEPLIQFLDLLPASNHLSREPKLAEYVEQVAEDSDFLETTFIARRVIEKWNGEVRGGPDTEPARRLTARKRKFSADANNNGRMAKRQSIVDESPHRLPHTETEIETDLEPGEALSLEDVCNDLQIMDMVEHVEAAVCLVRAEQFQWSDDHHSGMFILQALLLKITGTKELYKYLLCLQGHEAQTMLNALQLLLDFPGSIEPIDRRIFLKALLRLSSKSELYPKCLTLQQVERSTHALDEGSYGEVYRGRFENQNVALKVFKVRERSDISKILKAVWKEAILWSQFSHNNLLPFYGVYHLDDEYNRVCLVSPWMEHGNVIHYLKANSRVNRLLLLSDIALGMSYLHENEVIHGDLKGANILVSSSGRACLADFGLSKVCDPSLVKWTSVNTTSTHSGGTLRWQAPELFTPEDIGDVIVTTKSDIYSFACVCYEILTGYVPFYQISQPYTVLMRVMAGDRPSKPRPEEPAFQDLGLTESLWSLMEDCWSHDPNARPCAFDVLRHPALVSLVDRRQEQQRGGFSASQFRRAMTMLSDASG